MNNNENPKYGGGPDPLPATFQKASEVRNEELEPCHRYGGCKYNGKVGKRTGWFCDYCMLDLSIGSKEI